MKCYQRVIRDSHKPVAAGDPGSWQVLPITREDAASVILEYEWLHSMPKVGRAYYGLFSGNLLLGAACFGMGMGTGHRCLCGERWRDKAIALERGACRPIKCDGMHSDNAASRLISGACKQAYREYGWQIFFAYSDVEAGEIGTVYQACNWLYLGQGVGRGKGNTWRYQYITPEGETYTSRRWRAYKARNCLTWAQAEALGWSRRKHYDKHKYVWFEGGRRDKKQLRKDLRYPVLEYPKR